ncbi:MAG: hypothetical protein FWC20_00755 [Oscillospiraceae bacterium]|nr:hypothetical protein [Oscillospiraceae bacterium]MCL2277923.1 hypothetical protein [Oscillospiraceae bacterium]
MNTHKSQNETCDEIILRAVLETMSKHYGGSEAQINAILESKRDNSASVPESEQ